MSDQWRHTKESKTKKTSSPYWKSKSSLTRCFFTVLLLWWLLDVNHRHLLDWSVLCLVLFVGFSTRPLMMVKSSRFLFWSIWHLIVSLKQKSRFWTKLLNAQNLVCFKCAHDQTAGLILWFQLELCRYLSAYALWYMWSWSLLCSTSFYCHVTTVQKHHFNIWIISSSARPYIITQHIQSSTWYFTHIQPN